MNRELTIPVGGMYQEWDCLIDLLEQDKATELEKLASDSGWREVKPSEAESMGFSELVEWVNTGMSVSSHKMAWRKLEDS